MKSIKCAVILFLLPVASLPAFDQVSYNWFTDITGTIQFYDSAETPITPEWTFELGVFSSSANFGDTSTLAANFTSIRTFPWEIDIEGSGLNGSQAAGITYSYLSGYPEGLSEDRRFPYGCITTEAHPPEASGL